MDAKGEKAGIIIGLLASLIGLAILWHLLSLGYSILAMVILGCGGSLLIVGSHAFSRDVPDDRRPATINLLNISSLVFVRRICHGSHLPHDHRHGQPVIQAASGDRDSVSPSPAVSAFL